MHVRYFCEFVYFNIMFVCVSVFLGFLVGGVRRMHIPGPDAERQCAWTLIRLYSWWMIFLIPLASKTHLWISMTQRSLQMLKFIICRAMTSPPRDFGFGTGVHPGLGYFFCEWSDGYFELDMRSII